MKYWITSGLLLASFLFWLVSHPCAICDMQPSHWRYHIRYSWLGRRLLTFWNL